MNSGLNALCSKIYTYIYNFFFNLKHSNAEFIELGSWETRAIPDLTENLYKTTYPPYLSSEGGVQSYLRSDLCKKVEILVK